MSDKRAGFTLIEMLLSVALIGALVGVSLPVYISFQSRNELSVATTTTVEMLRRAQTFARSGAADAMWGVAFTQKTATLFKGNTYASRETALDEVAALPETVSVAGVTEITFSRLAGVPSQTGAVALTSNSGDVRTLNINAKGVIDY